MGVLLTAFLIVAGTGVGVGAEHRYPTAAVALARRFLRVILYVLVPIVIFCNLAKASISLENAVGLGLGWVTLTLVTLVAWFVASRVLKLPREQVGAVMVCALVANTAYLGYPLTVALLGHDHLATGVLFDVLVSGPALLLGAFGVGAAFGNRAGEGIKERAKAFLTRNPPLYAAILGLLVPRGLVPTGVVDASQVLAIAVLPIGFFAVGATLAEGAEHGEPRPGPGDPDAPGGAADRSPLRLPVDVGDADGPERDDRLPCLRARQSNRRRVDHLVDRDRGRRGISLTPVLETPPGTHPTKCSNTPESR
jgi:malate permease and related proteins